jgi:hypothetical protein
MSLVGKIVGSVGLVAIIAATTALIPLNWKRLKGRDPNRIEARELNYGQFLGMVAMDRWGLRGAESISYLHVKDEKRDDEFVRGRMSSVGFDLSLNVFRGDEHVGRNARELKELPSEQDWPTRPMPSWWEKWNRGEVRRYVFLINEDGERGRRLGGSMWEYRPATETVQIWEWLDR